MPECWNPNILRLEINLCNSWTGVDSTIKEQAYWFWIVCIFFLTASLRSLILFSIGPSPFLLISDSSISLQIMISPSIGILDGTSIRKMTVNRPITMADLPSIMGIEVLIRVGASFKLLSWKVWTIIATNAVKSNVFKCWIPI